MFRIGPKKVTDAARSGWRRLSTTDEKQKELRATILADSRTTSEDPTSQWAPLKVRHAFKGMTASCSNTLPQRACPPAGSGA